MNGLPKSKLSWYGLERIVSHDDYTALIDAHAVAYRTMMGTDEWEDLLVWSFTDWEWEADREANGNQAQGIPMATRYLPEP